MRKFLLLLCLSLYGPIDMAQNPAAPSAAALDSPESIRKSIDTGHPDAALAAVARVRASGAAVRGLDRLQGLALYAKGDLYGADAALAAALAADPGDMEAAQMRGLVLFRLGHPADAIPLLEQSPASTRGETDPNYILGLCYMDTSRWDDARRAFANQFRVAPDSAAGYLVAARMLLRRDYLPISDQFAHKALEIDPAIPLAHELLGELDLAAGHTDAAIAEFEAERARNPMEGSVYDRLGDAYLREGKLEDASRVLEEDILLEPHSTGPYILLGKTRLRQGDAVGAVTMLEHARAMDPSNYVTRNLLGQAYRAVGRKEDASREFAAVQRLHPASQPTGDEPH
ncbi:MAG TPA: tetratricopeptide repeat protein [Acidobacteriaceae bacterium]|nr:tetratricopeptide repeat protein [Acidobacteriaceae bacterium]